MPLRAHGPEPCVSANSTTPAIDCNTLLNSVGKSQFNDKYVQEPVVTAVNMIRNVQRKDKDRLVAAMIPFPLRNLILFSRVLLSEKRMYVYAGLSHCPRRELKCSRKHYPFITVRTRLRPNLKNLPALLILLYQDGHTACCWQGDYFLNILRDSASISRDIGPMCIV